MLAVARGMDLPVTEGARGFVFNADAAKLSEFLDVGTAGVARRGPVARQWRWWAYWVAKDGTETSDWEDGAAYSPEAGWFAAADGASTGSNSRAWPTGWCGRSSVIGTRRC